MPISHTLGDFAEQSRGSLQWPGEKASSRLAGAHAMETTPRRDFLKAAGLTAAALAVHTETARAADPRQVTIAVIGTGGMGGNHVRNLAARKDVKIAYLCDVDQNRVSAAAKTVESATGTSPQ